MYFCLDTGTSWLPCYTHIWSQRKKLLCITVYRYSHSFAISYLVALASFLNAVLSQTESEQSAPIHLPCFCISHGNGPSQCLCSQQFLDFCSCRRFVLLSPSNGQHCDIPVFSSFWGFWISDILSQCLLLFRVYIYTYNGIFNAEETAYFISNQRKWVIICVS